jgi:septum formation protein
MMTASPLWLLPEPLLLASRSFTRAALLASAGLPFETSPSEVDERAVEASQGPLSADRAALVLAEAKAIERSRVFPHRLVLGADQTLVCDGARLSKPSSRAAAAGQLRSLRGRRHQLVSGIALARSGEIVWSGRDDAELTMRDFSDDFLEAYLDAAGDAVLSSVGGYQLEGVGVQLFETIRGDHSTILGLPLLPLLAALRRLDAVVS